jgi:signal transduction histidine kinase
LKIKSYLILSFIFFCLLPTRGFGQAIDSLTRIINQAETDEERVAIYLDNAYSELLEYNQDKSYKILRYAQSAQKLAEKIDNKRELASSYAIIADVYLKQGRSSEALKANLDGLDIAKELDDDVLIYDFHTSLGIFHGTMRDLSKALYHFEEALDFARKDGLEYLAPLCLTNLGMVYSRMEKPEKALELQLEALKYEEEAEAKDESSILHTLASIGETYLVLDDNKNAIVYYSKGLNYISADELQGAARIYEGLSICYSNKGNISRGIQYGEKAVKAGEKLGDPSWLSDSYKSLSEEYEKAGLYKKSLENYKKYQTTYAQLFDKEQSDKTKELEVQYEVKENKIENEFLEKQLKQRNILVLIVLIMLIVLAFAAYQFFQNAKTKSSFNDRLKQEVVERTKELETANKELKQSYSELESYTYIASHDLKEPLRNIVSFSSLLGRKLKNNQDKDVPEYLSFIKNSANQMNELISSILELGVMRGQTMKLETLDLNLLLMEVIGSIDMDIQKHHAVLNFGDLPMVRGDKNGLKRVLSCLILNGIKFNKSARPEVHIHTSKEDNKVRIEIQDNGIGIDETYYEQVFQMYKRLHNRSEYTGSGVGLTISKRIVEAHESKIELTSELEKGSTFSFLLEEAS